MDASVSLNVRGPGNHRPDLGVDRWHEDELDSTKRQYPTERVLTVVTRLS